MAAHPSTPYRSQYLDAVKLMDDGKYEQCVELAETNLTDPQLSRYYRVKNLILAANITDDWYKGERYRRRGNDIWLAADRNTGVQEVRALEALRELRESLDELKSVLEAERPEDFEEEYGHGDLEDDEIAQLDVEKEELEELEDTEALAMAEESVWETEEARALGEAVRLRRELVERHQLEREEAERAQEEGKVSRA